MKLKINLYLLLVIILCFSTATGAEQSMLWLDNNGVDPETSESWKVDAGTLDSWQDSNFESLEYQTAGKSEVVGTGITVDGIKVDWSYPGSGFIGKGEDLAGGEGRLDQSIDYTVVAFAEIPTIMKMNVFGNGGEISSYGELAPLNEENDISETSFMVFSPSMGGIVDASWNFKNITAVDYGAGQAENLYINACDLWTANIWANAPYGFSVSSTGMGDSAGLENPLNIEMRYLERFDTGFVNQESDNIEVASNSDWAGDYLLNEDGVEIGTYEANQNAHINMQFRIPVTGAPAGRYLGEVTFSCYTI